MKEFPTLSAYEDGYKNGYEVGFETALNKSFDAIHSMFNAGIDEIFKSRPLPDKTVSIDVMRLRTIQSTIQVLRGKITCPD